MSSASPLISTLLLAGTCLLAQAAVTTPAETPVAAATSNSPINSTTAATVPAEALAPHHWYSNLFDPEDGAFDLSSFLLKPAGFFPMVTPITEPAVGAGAAVVPIFITLPKEGKGKPDIWAAGAMRTSNGSQGYFGGYSGYFDDQKWHVLAGAADMSINLDFHGLGKTLTFEGEPLRYNLDMTGGLLGADRAIDDSHWRAGARYLYGEVDVSGVRHRDSSLLAESDFKRRFGPPSLESVVSSVQTTLSYDTRDNLFTPTKGLFSEFNVTVNSEALGGSSDYQILNWTGIWYQPLVPHRLFLGLRADYTQSFGDVPFYRRPSVQLRGTPAQQYQGDGVTYQEAELRWQFSKRWSLLGFGGAGFTWAGDGPFRRTDATFTGGAGFRYLIARRHGLHAGVDFAYGDEGSAVYIQFGSAWFRP